MLDKIVVPLDGSDFAEAALGIAFLLARREDAAVEAVLVVPPSTFPVYLETPVTITYSVGNEARDFARGYLDALPERVRSDAEGIDFSVKMLEGPVVETLEAYLREGGGDLVVMTSHGRGMVSRAWLGSVSDGLIRQTPVPILLLRPDSPLLPAIEGHDGFKSALVPIDGTPPSLEILPDVFELAGPRTRYLLYRAFPTPVPVGSTYLPHLIQGNEETRRAKEAAKEAVEAAAEQLRELGAEAVETRFEEDDHPAQRILEIAEDEDVWLIAMATHGYGGMKRLVLGSVADKVARGTDRPVLLHRRPR